MYAQEYDASINPCYSHPTTGLTMTEPFHSSLFNKYRYILLFVSFFNSSYALVTTTTTTFIIMANLDWSFGIPGDGRCLFRSITHGACIREGKPYPSESLQKHLADELRAKVVDELIKRRAASEWFLECEFETYVKQMRQPHTWGGEPELLMSSHVLQMPITVYLRDKSSENLNIIAEYGKEYGKDNPICVLYHGYGHYDALVNPSHGTQSKLCMKR